MSGDHDMVADLAIVSDVDQVVEFDAIADTGDAQGSAVQAGVGADLHIVAHFQSADLRKFLPHTGHRNEAEAISAQNCSRVDDTAFTDDNRIIDRYARMEDGFRANADVLADGATGTYDRVIADMAARSNESLGADAGTCAHRRAIFHNCGGVDAGLGFSGRIKDLERGSKSGPWVICADHGEPIGREVGRNDQASRRGRLGGRPKFSRSDKSQFLHRCLIELGGTQDLHVSVTFKGQPQKPG